MAITTIKADEINLGGMFFTGQIETIPTSRTITVPNHSHSAGVTGYTLHLGEITKLNECDKDAKKYIFYNVTGMNPEEITVEPEWINKTESMYIKINGISDVVYLDYKKTISEKIFIDTEIYDKWECKIEFGVLTIILHEKLNPMPEFSKIEK